MKTSKRSRRPTKDPRGGLTAAGREELARKEGARLRPGVTKSVSQMTAEEMRRKGSWAVRFYGRKDLPPLVDEHGEPTRFALSAHAWGEAVPRTVAEARAIARKGRALLARAKSQATPKKKTSVARKRAGKEHPSLVENINARKRAGTSRPRSRSTVSKDAYDAMEHGWGRRRAAKKK